MDLLIHNLRVADVAVRLLQKKEKKQNNRSNNCNNILSIRALIIG